MQKCTSIQNTQLQFNVRFKKCDILKLLSIKAPVMEVGVVFSFWQPRTHNISKAQHFYSQYLTNGSNNFIHVTPLDVREHHRTGGCHRRPPQCVYAQVKTATCHNFSSA